MMFISVDLPAPFSPAMRMHLAAPEFEVDLAQRLDRAERLADVADLEDDLVGLGRRLRAGSVSRSCRGGAARRGGAAGVPSVLAAVRGTNGLPCRRSRSKSSALSLVMTAKPLSMKGMRIGL